MRWLLILLCCSLPLSSHAEWPTTIRENLPIAVDPEHSAIAQKTLLLDDDRIFVFWGGGTTQATLLYTILDRYGEPIFAEPRSPWPAILYGEPTGSTLRAASDSCGGVLLNWMKPAEPPNTTIWAQRVDASGNILWGDSAKAVSTINSSHYSGCAAAMGNYYFAVGTTEDGHDVYLQKLDSEGNACWGDSGIVVANASYNEKSPHVIPDNEGGIIVTWTDVRPPYTTYGALYAQRFDINGQPLWAPGGVFLVDEPGFRQELPDGNNGILVHTNPGGSFNTNSLFRFDDS
ncbi:hypothetical protein KKA08_09135, partial [bacterium]|nr:hypothetical protein [bacterium]